MDVPETFGAALRRRRSALGLTRDALARRVGCAVVTLRKIEADERRPSPELAERIAAQLVFAPDEQLAFLSVAHAPRTRQTVPTSPSALGEPGALLVTKLYPPPPRPNRVPRSDLVARLSAGLDHHALTLVAAPAGSGKTTLISAWLHELARSFAWLSLDEGDNDPVRFVGYMIATLQRVYPNLGAATLPLLQSPQPPPLTHILIAMLNAISASPKAAILVLDDYHLIVAPPIHDGMALLVEHLPPHLHLVLITRADPALPLSRMRARHQMTEVRAADLRFSLAEASAFLVSELGFALRPDDVAALTTRTEGWIAGLQLAALSLHDREDISAFIASFAGDDRYILDYLTEEVLQHQPPTIHDFLLSTAILDRLCAPLCDLLTGRDDAQVLLAQLDRANVFLIPLDNTRRWYRYHHLFADLLRYRLDQEQPERGCTLHTQASLWFEQHQLIDEAISHALRAQDFARAMQLIETAFHTIYYRRGEPYTLLHWIEAVPTHLAIANLRLNLIHAWCSLQLGQLDETHQRCNVIEAMLGADPDHRALRGELATLRGMICMFQADVVALAQLATEALDLLPAESVFLRGIALWQRGQVYHFTGDIATAAATFGEAAQLNRQAGNSMFELLSLSNQADQLTDLGQLRHAYEGHRRLQAMAVQGGQVPPFLGESYLRAALLAHEWGQLDQARTDIMQSLALIAQSHVPELMLNATIAQATILHDCGEIVEAKAALEQALEQARNYGVPHFLARAQAAHMRWLHRRGDLAGAWQILGTLAVNWTDPLRYLDEDLHLAYVEVALARGRAMDDSALLDDVLQRLDRMAERADSGGRISQLIRVRIQQALALAARRQPTQATSRLAEALVLAAPEGYLRTFTAQGEPMRLLLAAARATLADPQFRVYADRLIDACGVGALGRREVGGLTVEVDLIEPLSERERAVLRLMAAAHSNQEIAAALVVSVNTVKSHLQHIYAKLNVTSRLAAVETGRRLGLI